MSDEQIAQRVLVCGDVCGQFDKLFNRIRQIQKKSGNFDALFCVGNFFGEEISTQWKRYLSGEVEVPISTFILGPTSKEIARNFTDTKFGNEIAKNIFYLGHHGIYTNAKGLLIAYLSGSEEAKDDCSYTLSDVQDVMRQAKAHLNYNGVDILLTHQWPNGAELYSHQDVPPHSGCDLISDLAISVAPRYHFAASAGRFLERKPYRNHQMLVEMPRQVTRFIGLASIDNQQKERYIYAFTIKPLCRIKNVELAQQPPDTTENPYRHREKKIKSQKVSKLQATNREMADEQSVATSQFFFAASDVAKVTDGGETSLKRSANGGNAEDGEVAAKRAPDPCWFCLSSPDVAKHLVISVASETYIALARGPLTDDNAIILPIAHHRSLTACPDEVLVEVEKYKECIHELFASEKKSPVFFERNWKQTHAQLQVIAIPTASVPCLKARLMECSDDQGCTLHEIPENTNIKQVIPEGVPYLLVDLPTGERLFHRIAKDERERFPMQFVREVLARMLNLPHKTDWRRCIQGEDDERKSADSLRNKFQPFDFSLQ